MSNSAKVNSCILTQNKGVMRAGPGLGLAVMSVTLMNYSLRGARSGVLGIAQLRAQSLYD